MYQTDEASNDTGRYLQIIDSDAKDLLSRANPPPNPKKTGGSNYNANSYSGYEESDNRPSKYGGYKANSGYEENESKYGGYNKAYSGYEENESKQSKYGGYNKTYSGYEENENRSSKYGGYKANSAYSGYGSNENKSSNYNNYDSYQNNDFGKDPYSNENHDHGYSKQQSSNNNDQVVPSVQEIYYSNSTNFLKTANNDSSLNSTTLNVQPNTSQPPPPPPPQSQLLMRSENDLPDKTDYLNPKPDKTYAYAQMDYATNPGAIKDFNGYERLDYDQVLSSVQINLGLEITHVFLDYSSRNELHEITLQLMEAVTLDRIVLAIQRDDQLAETYANHLQKAGFVALAVTNKTVDAEKSLNKHSINKTIVTTMAYLRDNYNCFEVPSVVINFDHTLIRVKFLERLLSHRSIMDSSETDKVSFIYHMCLSNSSTAQNLKEYVESQELQKMLF